LINDLVKLPAQLQSDWLRTYGTPENLSSYIFHKRLALLGQAREKSEPAS